LKGGYALELRLGNRARTTKDVDIEWLASTNEALDALLNAAAYDTGDHFVYEIERTSDPPERLGGSLRFSVLAFLAGRLFDRFVLDVGFRPQRNEPVTRVTLWGGLEFAGIDDEEINAVHIELQIAEKLHAYTRTFAAGRTSSRTKDLVDLILIAESLPLDAARLRGAITETFAQRDSHAKPSAFPTPPSKWATPFRVLATAIDTSYDLNGGHQLVASLLDPVLQGTVLSGTWIPDFLTWSISKE